MSGDGVGRFLTLCLVMSPVVVIAVLAGQMTVLPTNDATTPTRSLAAPPPQASRARPVHRSSGKDPAMPIASEEANEAPESIRAVELTGHGAEAASPPVDDVVADILRIRTALGEPSVFDASGDEAALSVTKGSTVDRFEHVLRQVVTTEPRTMSTAQDEEPSWKSPPPPPPHIPITGGVEHLVELAWRLDRMAHELEIAARYSSADDLRAVATDLRAAARDAEQSASD